MRKRAKPCQHKRRVRTSKGTRVIIVNPGVKKKRKMAKTKFIVSGGADYSVGMPSTEAKVTFSDNIYGKTGFDSEHQDHDIEHIRNFLEEHYDLKSHHGYGKPAVMTERELDEWREREREFWERELKEDKARERAEKRR